MIFYPLAYLLFHPGEVPSGQQVRVHGYLAKPGLNPRLYLTSEHAEADDFMSSIVVGDPSEDGSFTMGDCFGHFVAVTGTFVDSQNGRLIADPILVEYKKSAPEKFLGESRIVCWSWPPAA